MTKTAIEHILLQHQLGRQLNQEEVQAIHDYNLKSMHHEDCDHGEIINQILAE